MNKILTLGLLLAMLLGSCACNEDDIIDYEAYVTIVNIGNIAINAAVEDQWHEIPAYSAVTWAVLLDYQDQVADVLAEAEPVGYDDYESETIRVYGDRDVQTWLVGWDAAGRSSDLRKKASQVLSGQQDVNSLIARYR